MVDVKKIALFVGGVVFGSAGFKVLASRMPRKFTPRPLPPSCA